MNKTKCLPKNQKSDCTNNFRSTGRWHLYLSELSWTKFFDTRWRLDSWSAIWETCKNAKENCFTATVLICRKMLMNIAVAQGATENLKFIEYVNFLADNGYVPPNGRRWVDHIRKKGNEATHEIQKMNKEDAKDLLFFTEMLLIFLYEFPAMIPE